MDTEDHTREAGLGNGAKKFAGALEQRSGMLGWTTVEIPFDVGDWPEMIRLRVRGEINGFGFRTSLFPQAGGGLCVLVTRAMQRESGARLGGRAEFVLWPDLDPRPAELPDELAVLLDDEPGLRGWYDGLTEYTRREIGKWVLGVKSDEARVRRAQQMAERLLSTMEAEVELPPLIQAAFKVRPKAKAGWAKMTETQRRGELMAVFHYQTPESREKRLGKMCDLAETKA